MVEAMRDRGQNTKTPVSIKRKPRKAKTPKEPVVLGNRKEYKCNYCGREFSREATVVTHLCEERRRYQQKDSLFARYGYEAFIAINYSIFGNKDQASEEAFRKSTLYLACLRWGHFVIDIHCLDYRQYLEWLLKLNVPIDQWDRDEIYDFWLQHYVFIEEPWDSFERSVKKISEWAEEVVKPYADYFSSAGTARILTDIRKGYITGWVVFCGDSGKQWLGSLEPSDLELVWAWINPERWKVRFTQYSAVTEEITEICKQSGL